LARHHDRLDQSRQHLQRALSLLPPERRRLRGRTLVYLGVDLVETDIRQAETAFAQARQLLDIPESVPGALAAGYFQSWAQWQMGELRRAAATARRTLDLANQVPGWPVACYGHLALIQVHYELNELEAAADHLPRATRLAEASGNFDYRFIATLRGAVVHRALGQWAEAQRLLDRLEALARSSRAVLLAQIDEEQIRLWLAQGRRREAWQRAQDRFPPDEQVPALPHAFIQLNWARAVVAEGRGEEVMPLLAKVTELTDANGLARLGLQARLLRAIGLHQAGQTRRALDELAQALALGEPEGYLRVYLDEGPDLVPLLRQAGSQGLAPRHVARLLDAFGPQAGKAPDQPLVEPLSPRELEVLHLLGEGKNNQEMATALVVSVGTIKRHLSNIYGKLNVETRMQCVARARDLSLLSQ
jgi:LuxR family maltose regulon positive regulatory protein